MKTLCRICAGMFAGSIVGSLVELAFFWDGPPAEGIKLPVMGPLLGAGLVDIVGGVVGELPVGGWLRTLAINILTGVVLCVAIGFLIYAPIMTASDPFADKLFRGKEQSRYQQIGALFGVLAGVGGGLLLTAIQYAATRRSGVDGQQVPMPNLPNQTNPPAP